MYVVVYFHVVKGSKIKDYKMVSQTSFGHISINSLTISIVLTTPESP